MPASSFRAGCEATMPSPILPSLEQPLGRGTCVVPPCQRHVLHRGSSIWALTAPVLVLDGPQPWPNTGPGLGMLSS